MIKRLFDSLSRQLELEQRPLGWVVKERSCFLFFNDLLVFLGVMRLSAGFLRIYKVGWARLDNFWPLIRA